MNLKYFTVIILSIATVSCSISPAGFWTKYRPSLIVEKTSDQGSRGGIRTIYWSSDKHGDLKPEEVLEFAQGKGWKLTDEKHIATEELEQLIPYNSPSIPIAFTNFEEGWDSISYTFPTYFWDDFTLYKFETSWVKFYPGSDNFTSENGIIRISDDGTKMTLYHIWGE